MDERRPIDTAAATTMVALCALWGTQQVAIKLASPDMAPVLQIGVRSFFASLIVLGVVLARSDGHALVGGNWRPGLLAGALFGLEFVLFAHGLRFTSASHMSIFLYTAPIFAALGLHLCLPEERLAPFQWVGIALAFVGIVLTFSNRGQPAGGDDAWVGDLLGIAAGMAWGATTLVVRTTNLSRAPAAVTLWYQLTGACVLGLAVAASFGETHATFTGALVASLAYQTVILSTFSYLVWFSLLRTYLASRLGILTLMTPVFGIGFGVVLLGDELTDAFVAGAVLILIGIIMVSGRDLLSSRAARAAVLQAASHAGPER